MVEDELEMLSPHKKMATINVFESLGSLAQSTMDDTFDIPKNELCLCGRSGRTDIPHNTAVCIENAVKYQNEALLPAPDVLSEGAYQLGSFGIALLHKFERFGNLADINKAIQYLTQAMQLTPSGHPNYLASLNNLGSSYRVRFECLGEVADLDQAIQFLTQAAQLTPNSHPLQPGILSYLGNTYMRRFKRLGGVSDVDQALQCQTQAVQLSPDGHPEKPVWLTNLGKSYWNRFECLGEVADVDQAIQCQTRAVQLTPNDHHDKPATLSNLGGSHICRFERLGELKDVEDAIHCLTQAVQLTPEGHPDKPIWLNNLGNSSLRRFERLGEVADVDQAIQCQTQAVQLTPDGHLDKHKWLNNLGSSYLRRFERLGEVADADRAIDCQTQAVQLTADGHPDRPDWLNNLGGSYMRRFERLGEPADVDRAIECQAQAVQETPDDHPHKPATLDSLGSSYLCRFERLQVLADVDQAIQYQTQAVQLTPDDHPNKPACLNHLGNSYQSRFECLGKLSDIDQAIQCHSRAVQLTTDGHSDKLLVALLNNLGNTYLRRFKRLDEIADLDQAIRCQTQAVQLTPDGHADKPVTLNNLATTYDYRFKATKSTVDLEFALSYFQQAARLVVTNPQRQLRCARKWATSCVVLGRSPLHAYERSFELLPHVVWLGATIERRYNLLTSVSDLATEAASWAISVGSYDLAIEWLEQGRSIVWNQILGLRTPLDELSVDAPGLAQHLKDIAIQLERAGSRQATLVLDRPSIMLPDLEAAAQHHHRLAAEWENYLQEVRNIPGFHDFMKPRNATELRSAATDGPVVLINTHSRRWDALIVFPQCDDIVHLPLVTLPPKEASGPDAQLSIEYAPERRGGGFGRVKKGVKLEDPLKVELAELWEVVVKPILDTLAFTEKLPVDELPHVTWCATGPLAFAPLHAAGAYDGSSPNAIDLVISSYTPSLSALLAPSTSSSKPDIGVLAIGQQYTNGHPPLPYTMKELAAIKIHAQGTNFLQLDGNSATVDEVLNAMDEWSWVHLACHATQNPDNPAHSAFHLCDGNLTLEAITKRAFKNKGLAFLSACHTAKGDGKLPDESVHLAAGMLMAGYPSVIATMWSIVDKDGPEVAGRVYAELLKDGKMNHSGAARALHRAVAELRGTIGEDSFERWVPYIHIGL